MSNYNYLLQKKPDTPMLTLKCTRKRRLLFCPSPYKRFRRPVQYVYKSHMDFPIPTHFSCDMDMNHAPQFHMHEKKRLLRQLISPYRSSPDPEFLFLTFLGIRFSLFLSIMDQRTGAGHSTFISILVAALSLSLTVYTTLHNRSNPGPIPETIRVFNLNTGEGISHIIPNILDKDARTNRTVWETVDTPEIHAGLERLEVDAWIPPHAHNTEEIIMVCAGVGLVYDENGHSKRMETGSMVHIAAHARHAFRNVEDEPLVIMWLFPSLFSTDKFSFKQRYNQPL